MDDLYLDLAVGQLEQFLQGTTAPKSDATFTHGRPTNGRPTNGRPWRGCTGAERARRVAADARAKAPAGEPTAWWPR